MSIDFEQALKKYAELILRVGLNLQPGQRLLISGPAFNGGVPIETAPLIRLVTAQAYQMGARLVDVIWTDEQLQLIRFQNAPRDSFDEFPTWKTEAVHQHLERGDAYISVTAGNPDLLKGQDPALVSKGQQVAWKHLEPALGYVTRNAVNWLVIAASTTGWAAKVFPDLPAEEQVGRLWETIFRICRVDRADPVAAWKDHIRDLHDRSGYLNGKAYRALRLRATGTDLTVGLPEGHLWKSGQARSETGIEFTANLPTEEVFTMPHKDRTEGTVRSTKPLSYAGTVIEDFSLTFKDGRVTAVRAAHGEEVLQKLVESDEGAGRLGEVALVPFSSPISQSGLLFYNTLIDENAASHLAVGRAYKFTHRDGAEMNDEAFAAAGGNGSLIHVDFMIGSGEMEIDGIRADGSAEAVMRGGEWAFRV